MDAGAKIAWPERFNHDEAVGHPARDEPQAAGRSGVLRRVPERAAAGSDPPDDDAAHGRPDRREAQRLPRATVPDRLHAPDDVHRRAGDAAVLPGRGAGRRISPATSSTTAPIPTSSGRTSRCAMPGPRWPTWRQAPGWKGRSTPAWKQLTSDLLGREWRRDDGAHAADRALPDRRQLGYVHRRGLPVLPAVGARRHLMPSHGRFVGASSMPFAEYRTQPGDRVGHNWRIPNVPASGPCRHVRLRHQLLEVVYHRAAARGDGRRAACRCSAMQPEQHRLFAEHLTAEYRVTDEGVGGRSTNGSCGPSGATTTGSIAWWAAPWRHRCSGRVAGGRRTGQAGSQAAHIGGAAADCQSTDGTGSWLRGR